MIYFLEEFCLQEPLFWIGALAGIAEAVLIAIGVTLKIVIRSNDWGYRDEGSKTIRSFKVEDQEDGVKESYPLHPENVKEKRSGLFSWFN